jgi:hypothetical protein
MAGTEAGHDDKAQCCGVMLAPMGPSPAMMMGAMIVQRDVAA